MLEADKLAAETDARQKDEVIRSKDQLITQKNELVAEKDAALRDRIEALQQKVEALITFSGSHLICLLSSPFNLKKTFFVFLYVFLFSHKIAQCYM